MVTGTRTGDKIVTNHDKGLLNSRTIDASSKIGVGQAFSFVSFEDIEELGPENPVKFISVETKMTAKSHF